MTTKRALQEILEGRLQSTEYKHPRCHNKQYQDSQSKEVKIYHKTNMTSISMHIIIIAINSINYIIKRKTVKQGGETGQQGRGMMLKGRK